MPSIRILIVEDQRQVSKAIRLALQSLDPEFEMVEIPSAEEAILEVSRQSVDMLITNYRLPGSSGVQLIRKIKSDHPQVKVILLVGQADADISDLPAGEGADACLIKPLRMTDFLETARELIGQIPVQSASTPPRTKKPPQPRLPDIVTGLRRELSAEAVLLLDSTGEAAASAGSLPDGWEIPDVAEVAVPVLAQGGMLSSRLSREIKTGLVLWSGSRCDLLIVPLLPAHVLVAAGRGLGNPDRLSPAARLIQEAARAVEGALASMASGSADRPVPQQAVQKPEAKSTKRSGSKLAANIGEKTNSVEADEFWDKAVSESRPPASPDTLSYEQARGLGLLPGEES